MSDHYGNLEIYGYVTVGKNTNGSYRFPLAIGENGEFMGIEDGEVVFKRPGPSIYIEEISGASELIETVDQLVASIGGISGSIDTFEELLDTPPFGDADSHEGEIVIVNPNASSEVQKIVYSGIKIEDITTDGVQTINSESPSAGNIDFVSDGSLDIIPNGDGTIQISLYVAISTSLSVTSVDVSGVGSVSSNSLERGMVVEETSLDWDSYNKTPISQSLNQGIGSISVGTTDYTHSSTYSSNRTYTLTYSDDKTTKNTSTTVSFRDRRFWGTTSSSSNLGESDVEAGSSQLSSSRSKSITFAANGDRIFYAYPTSFGLATVKDENGLNFQSWIDGGAEVTVPYTISVTNAYGYTQDYYVYQSFNTFGSSSITFVWS
jgi:hypothetical protein